MDEAAMAEDCDCRESLSGSRVMVVEDEALVAMGLEGMLRSVGCSVVVCHDVASALSGLARQGFDAVLCDMALPDGNAGDVLLALDGMGGDPPPVLIISGWAGTAGGLRLPPEAPRPAAVLSKPVDRALLLKKLGRVVADK